MSELDTPRRKVMLERMAQARAIDHMITDHVKHSPFDGYWHPGEGHEGAPIGVTEAMRDDDYLAYHFRGSAWALGKGMPLDPVIGDLFGRVTGSTGGKGAGSPKWADLQIGLLGEGGTLGSCFVIAGGAAMTIDMLGTDQVAVAAFGDGTSARGTFHETLLQAATWKLPLIYFCENNGLQVASPLEEWNPTKTIAERASAYGVPGVEVDGQDAVAVYDVTREAIERARKGEGPTLIEAHVIRARGHYEGDESRTDPATYRDPLEILAGQVDGAEEIIARAKADVDAAYQRAMEAPVADPDIIYKDVFA